MNTTPNLKSPLSIAFRVFSIALLLMLNFSLLANNLSISAVRIASKDPVNDYAMVEFDISWENSWRLSSSPSNWDAAWIFIKYRVNRGDWAHASLNTSGGNHSIPSGASMDLPADGKGIFLYRNANGTGTFTVNNVQLRWEYGTDGLGDSDTIDIKVFGIEMVYVSSGSYYLSAGGSGVSNEFFSGGIAGSSFQVNIEAAITVSNTSGNLYYAADNANGGDRLGPIPAAFPKGYQAFYCMKYELTQEQWIDFFNTLTSTQKPARDITAGTYEVTGKASDALLKGNNINWPGTGDAYLNGGTYAAVACGFLSWMDVCAYADWAALRPMTDLEYEKACRGPNSATIYEYAWGTNLAATSVYGVINQGNSGEAINLNFATGSTTGNVAYRSTTNGSFPFRVGIFATHPSSNGRVNAGASYWGIMELSGSMWERIVSMGNSTGRAFTGLHGDGVLSTAGHANVSYWPGLASGEVTTAVGAGFRGGAFNAAALSLLCVADRNYAALVNDRRGADYGFRVVRTAP
ncbi:SUMF1/EgtB/PvdO family nonheme iron enzyme [Croceimicrobium hydrocarbonivorans]|uniref:SUMF1/EgtB/PvdO family nonheme iron enzyme n=1 Tax=Croceimicrobium hydrocarbonivorans TaxID=2761580 RepID=A0A7H0VH17_9FLAO|nr:SUMF1/EgtB/PvdO family nonheme iron enzyme [Croceimicrobium hydrocarbonivorans]QNR25015.1 SUMF1/EgtB/PvdO family nonheme iron enzyme [Croceimicrobium hydrocarbonivorans]